MANRYQNPKVKREIRLAVFMLVILIASVATAFLVVHLKGASTRQAISILEDLRKPDKGLANHWNAEPELRFYSINYGGQKGWEMQLREPLAQGGFHGVSIFNFPNSPLEWKYWSLNDDATEGLFKAGLLSSNSDPYLNVTYSSEKISVKHSAVNFAIHANAPDNFLPDGLIPYALAQVAKQNKEARFVIQFNSTLSNILPPPKNSNEQAQFLQILIKPEKPLHDQVDGTFQVSLTYDLLNITETFTIDELGNQLSYYQTSSSPEGNETILTCTLSDMPNTLGNHMDTLYPIQSLLFKLKMSTTLSTMSPPQIDDPF